MILFGKIVNIKIKMIKCFDTPVIVVNALKLI